MNQPVGASQDTGIQVDAPSAIPPAEAGPPQTGITKAPPGLGLWDVVSIIVGIVIGTGIYETPPRVFSQVSGPLEALAVWALCGLLAFIGALCYAELATAYPRTGGDYVYLSRAFGSWVGFLFGWAQLAVILTGSIGMMAYVFAEYAVKMEIIPKGGDVLVALLVVLVLTILNVMGLVFGKWTQNLLSAAKVLSLGGILVAGLCWPAPETAAVATTGGTTSLALALVFVLYTYGGWNDAAFVAADVRHPRRNIPRALLLGTGLVTLLYVLVNAAYLRCLGFDRARQASNAIAAAVLEQGPLGQHGMRIMCVLVMISALGNANGLILAGARVLSALGTDHGLFAWLARGSIRRRAPVGAILALAAISLGLIAAAAPLQGHSAFDAVLSWMGVATQPLQGASGFDVLLSWTAPVFWLFFLLTSLSLFVLRFRDKNIPRPFRVPFYPIVPLVFSATCAYMLYASIEYAKLLGLVGGGLLVLGLPLLAISRQLRPISTRTGSAAR
jgi:amino acid transporter